MQYQVIRLQPKQSGLVYFDSDPRNARIYVDGQILTDPDTEESLRTPTKTLLIEGRRYFTFSLEGYNDESGYVDVLAGTTVNIYRRLKQGKSGEGWGQPQQQWYIGNQHINYQISESESPYVEYINVMKTMQQPSKDVSGNVVITTFPDGATITLDGKLVIDTETKEPLKTPVDLVMYMGTRNLVFSLPGYFDEFATVYVSPGATLYVHNNFNIADR